MSDQDDAEVEHREWDFEPGDIVAEEHPTTIRQSGVDVHSTGGTEYTIKRRLIDIDADAEGFYHVEYEDGKNVKTTLKSASMVEMIHEKVGESDER